MSQKDTLIVEESLAEVFDPLIKNAAQSLNFKISEESAAYVLAVLESTIFTEPLFLKVGEKNTEPMLSESLLKALQQPGSLKKRKELKNLGESILLKSGFFAESLNRKIIGLSYYIEMGRVVYKNLYETAPYPAYQDLSSRFPGYVDLFSVIRKNINFENQEDLLMLFERYFEVESKAAYLDLLEKGIFPADNKKASNQ